MKKKTLRQRVIESFLKAAEVATSFIKDEPDDMVVLTAGRISDAITKLSEQNLHDTSKN